MVHNPLARVLHPHPLLSTRSPPLPTSCSIHTPMPPCPTVPSAPTIPHAISWTTHTSSCQFTQMPITMVSKSNRHIIALRLPPLLPTPRSSMAASYGMPPTPLSTHATQSVAFEHTPHQDSTVQVLWAQGSPLLAHHSSQTASKANMGNSSRTTTLLVGSRSRMSQTPAPIQC